MLAPRFPLPPAEMLIEVEQGNVQLFTVPALTPKQVIGAVPPLLKSPPLESVFAVACTNTNPERPPNSETTLEDWALHWTMQGPGTTAPSV